MQNGKEIVPIVTIFTRVDGLLLAITRSVGRFAASCIAAHRHRRMVRRSRRDLHWLTSDQLRDIGLTRGDAFREYRKSYFID